MSLLLAALLLSASPASASARAPRLTLFIAVDSMGSDVFLRNAPHFQSGFAQLLKKGAFFPDARYQQSQTVTAAGHAVLSTGAYPWRTGAIGNRMFNRSTGRLEPIFADPDHPVLEAPLRVEDVSPTRLETETLLDHLRLATRQKGKAVSLSAKARAAIAMGGHLSQVFWFSPDQGTFVTGTFYAKQLPAWLAAFNARKEADAYFDAQWKPLLPARAYTGSDDREFEPDPLALGRAFPHPVSGGETRAGKKYREALELTPYMDDLLVKAAKAAIAGEGLGKDEVPDILAVSFSSIDLIFHAYGPYSWEMQDALARLDRNLGDLIAAAQKAAGGAQNLLVVLSADHGGAALPEEWSAAGLPAGRVDTDALARGLEQALAPRFGAGLVAAIDEENVYFDPKIVSARRIDEGALHAAAAEWLMRQPPVALAVPAEALRGTAPAEGYLGAMQRSSFPGRSGEVMFITRPFQVVTDAERGTAHAMPYAYDTQVPILLMGPGVKPGRYARQVHPTDVAPTLAALLGMGAPASSEGEALFDALATH